MELSQYKRPESVLVVVHSLRGDVLLLRRAYPAHFWQSVTGSLEWQELAGAAARRELHEETGLAADGLEDCRSSQRFVIYPFWRYRYPPGVEENLEHVFRLCLDEPRAIRLDDTEHTDYGWFPRREAVRLATSHTNRDAIERWVPHHTEGL